MISNLQLNIINPLTLLISPKKSLNESRFNAWSLERHLNKKGLSMVLPCEQGVRLHSRASMECPTHFFDKPACDDKQVLFLA